MRRLVFDAYGNDITPMCHFGCECSLEEYKTCSSRGSILNCKIREFDNVKTAQNPVQAKGCHIDFPESSSEWGEIEHVAIGDVVSNAKPVCILSNNKPKCKRKWSNWKTHAYLSILDKYKTNGKIVKVQLRNYNTGEVLGKGEASCSPEDEFDLDKGIRLAYARACVNRELRRM